VKKDFDKLKHEERISEIENENNEKCKKEDLQENLKEKDYLDITTSPHRHVNASN
jgi:hypothetical protein